MVNKDIALMFRHLATQEKRENEKGGAILKHVSKEKALENLNNRIMLCSRGLTLPDESVSILHLQSVQGGAGPQGISCHVGDAPGSYNSQISLVIFPKDHYLAKHALSTKWWNGGEIEKKEASKKILHIEEKIFLERVSPDWKGSLPDGRKISRLSKARFHPYHTFSICLYRTCRHFDQNEGCKYCTANLLIDKLNFANRLPDQENLAYLKTAMSNNPIRSVTLTSGTFNSPETTALELLSLAKLIREETGLSVHIQTEPIFDYNLLKELSQVVDTIGIFLEFFDEKVRQRICPGKARIFTQDDYLKSWEMAVSCFGWGKVFTTNILGFDEDYDVIIKGVEKSAKIGTMTSLLWLRVGSPELGQLVPSYIGRENEMSDLHQEVGKILVKNSVDSISPENSGCMGCHGCNATREAVQWARSLAGKEKEKNA